MKNSGPFYIAFRILKLAKFIKYSHQLLYFSLFHISFYISRYHLQFFKTSFNITCKKIFVTVFPLLSDSLNPENLPPPTHTHTHHHPHNDQNLVTMTKFLSMLPKCSRFPSLLNRTPVIRCSYQEHLFFHLDKKLKFR